MIKIRKLSEEWISDVLGHYGIFKNPTPSEAKECIDEFGGNLRAIVDNEGNMYCMNAPNRVHYDMIDLLSINKIIKREDKWWESGLFKYFVAIISREFDPNTFYLSTIFYVRIRI